MSIVSPAQPAVPSSPSPARQLPAAARQRLAVEALAGEPVSELARQQHVSRRFVYRQLEQARTAIDEAFEPSPDEPPELLFWLPVSRPWLHQLVLGLTLICHSSLRGVTELLRDLFDYPLSLGSVHAIVHQAVERARAHNDQQDLAAIRVGAQDEIFQAGRPVLVGADVASSYCYLLCPEEHRDADTWGVRLLELAQRGFHPDATVADFSGSLRAGQAAALPEVPCAGDVFHALHVALPLVRYLENRAYEAIGTRSRLEERLARSEQRQGRKDLSLVAQLRHARETEAAALERADALATLVGWLREDVLALHGPDLASRRLLYDWIVAEMRAREAECPHRIRPVRRLLENHRDELLSFADRLERDLQQLAEAHAVPAAVVEEVRQVLGVPASRPEHWQREQRLWQRLGARYGPLREAVAEVLGRVVRASSVIENLNSRLRGYFFLRRHLGGASLALLQFFLNHRRFLRSEHPERVGKSPAELLTAQAHPHWLELLGFTPFSRN